MIHRANTKHIFAMFHDLTIVDLLRIETTVYIQGNL